MNQARLIAVAAEDERGLDGEVSAHFGRCPYYVLVETNGDTVTGSRIVSNPYFEVHRPGVVPRFIRDLGSHVIIAGGMGPRAIEMFHGFASTWPPAPREPFRRSSGLPARRAPGRGALPTTTRSCGAHDR
jgi:hypothetical protein